MSTVTPPPPRTPVPPQGGPSLASAIVLKPPPVLSSLQPGQAFTATMTAQLAAGQLQVDTAFGLLTLQTGLNIPKGAVLSLVLSAHHPRPTVHIAAVNGQPVGAAKAGQGQVAQGLQASTQPLQAGQTVTATLLRPADGVGLQASQSAQGGPQGPATSQGATQSPAPAQSGQGARAAQATSSAPNAAQTSGPSSQPAQALPSATGPRGSAATTSPSAPGSGGQGGATPQASSGAGQAALGSQAAQSGQARATLPAGTRFSATIQRIDAPGAALATQSAAAAKPLAQGQVLTGAVSGRTQAGQPIVQTPAAPFALGAPGTLAEGAKVSFRLDSLPLAPLEMDDGLEALQGLGRERVGTGALRDLTDALRHLAQADPARLAQVAQNALPQPGAKLSNQMLFFLSALKGGNVRGLFGDASMRILETERPDLAQRLGSDFQTMARLADEPQQGDWRLALIPLWNGEELDQLRLFWRHGGGGEGGEDDGEETRFVLDVELSRLGHLQIDGLVKAKRHHLDLIVRSDQPLPQDMRAEIAEIFDAARDTAGLGGQVGFQAKPANFIAVPEPSADAPPGTAGPGLFA